MKEQHCSRKTAIVTAILIASITFGLCLTFILTVSKFDECHFDNKFHNYAFHIPRLLNVR